MKQIILAINYCIIKVYRYFKVIFQNFYVVFIKPKKGDEETYRKELVCNLLLIFILALTILLNILVLKSFIYFGPINYTGIRPHIMLLITGSIMCLLYLSRKGYVAIVSGILIWLLITGCIYGQFTWGADLPSVILLWCFIITSSSILISTRYSFFLTIAIGVETILFQILENKNIIQPVKVWKNTNFKLDDAIEYTFIFTLIAGVSWISNREIFKSLIKVKQSKLELQNERDSLEIKVMERTNELHQVQVDKINNMYQLVEFGRISSGLFHDLITPLNTLDIAIQQISKDKDSNKTNIEQLKKQLDLCLRTSSRVVDFISLAKRQIQQNNDHSRFEINNEVQNSINLLGSKARCNNVQLVLKNQRKIFIKGSPTLFSHIITNLISNSIDSYQEIPAQNYDTTYNQIVSNRLVIIYTQKKHRLIEIKIKDFGIGIPTEIQQKIFDPFFTTKMTKGCGIGLSATKHTLEKYFGGTISFISNEKIKRSNQHSKIVNNKSNLGTTFTIKIPTQKHSEGTSHNQINTMS